MDSQMALLMEKRSNRMDQYDQKCNTEETTSYYPPGTSETTLYKKGNVDQKTREYWYRETSITLQVQPEPAGT